MTAVPVAERMTAEEYLALPLEGRRTELIDGVIIVHEPKALHQGVLGELYVAIVSWTRAAPGRGRAWLPLDVLMDEHSVYAPDLLWYAADRGPRRGDPRPSAVPDLAVEVRSPSTWRYDLGAKKSGYERVGLPELWLVDTAAEEILVFRRSTPAARTFDISLRLERAGTLTSPAMPGFALPLAVLFAGDDD